MGALGTFIGGAKFWLIGLALATIAAFGAGYYYATQGVETKLIAAQVENFNRGVAAQKNFDDEAFEIASTDADKRHRDDLTRQKKLQALLNNLLVPRVDACVVSPEAMKALNEVAQ